MKKKSKETQRKNLRIDEQHIKWNPETFYRPVNRKSSCRRKILIRELKGNVLTEAEAMAESTLYQLLPRKEEDTVGLSGELVIGISNVMKRVSSTSS